MQAGKSNVVVRDLSKYLEVLLLKFKILASCMIPLLLAVFFLYISAEVPTAVSERKTVSVKPKLQKKGKTIINREKPAGPTKNKTVITDENIKVTFVELGATKCIPCRMMQPIMEEIEKEYGTEVKVIFYDVWEDRTPAIEYKINLIPTQVFLDKTGKEYFRHEGFLPKKDILKILEKQGITIKED